jgi:hypothetical protein
MFIAEKLGLTLEQALELSDLEFRLWIAYYTNQAKEQKRAMDNGKRRNHR